MGTGEYGWDDIIQNDSSFTEIPEGDYDFVIDHFERGRSTPTAKTPECNMAIVFFTIKLPDGQEATIKENYVLHKNFEWKLSELFRGIGMKKKNEECRMNWNALPGLAGRAHVTLDPDKNNPDRKYNHIRKIYDKEIKKFEPGKF